MNRWIWIALVAAIVQGAAAADPRTQEALRSGASRPRRADATPPQVATVSIPVLPGAQAVWGATGQDARGHVWFGVTIEGIDLPSAHLFEYDPQSRQLIDRGNVAAELKRAGMWRPGEHQAKIHSRIVQGPDNCLYFASMDEEGEKSDGSRLPTWGGHLWRLRLATNRWEHLLTTREALIAVAGGGRFIYALGYFGHVLYRYDATTGRVERVDVGSVDGHISRNFLVDYRGHAYVPRLRAEPGPGGRRLVRVTLVEFSSELKQITETPLPYEEYVSGDRPTESHGIVALQAMDDRSIFFTTHVGMLYHVIPPAPVSGALMSEGPAAVRRGGWFHPGGSRYVASLFTPDGMRTLYGVALNLADAKAVRRYEWVACEASGASCGVAALESPAIDSSVINGSLLYGSSTRDAQGGHYVVGMTGGYQPIILRVQPSTGPAAK